MENNNQTLVSIVIPCYNHEQFVQECIQSVIDQTYDNIELIIIDDGSKDNSVEKIQQMVSACEKRFSRFEFRKRSNRGLCETLNEAIEWCQGEYLSVIASDDFMMINKTQRQVDFLNLNRDCAAVFGGINLVKKNNKIIGSRLSETKSYSFDEIFLNNHDLPASTQMTRVELIRNIGGYDPTIKVEDWYMLLKMTSMGFNIIYLNEIFCGYRFHDNNFSKNISVMVEEMIKIINEYKNHKQYKKSLRKLYRIEFSYYMKQKFFSKAFSTLIKFFVSRFV